MKVGRLEAGNRVFPGPSGSWRPAACRWR